MPSAIIQNCPFQDPDDICKWLRDQIHKKVLEQKSETGVRGLKERIMDQIYGRNGPMNANGSPNRVWNTHDDEITNLRKNIQDHIDEHQDRDCGDRYPISKGVKYWARHKNPAPSEWKGPAQMVAAEPDRPSLFDLKRWEKITGLAGASLITYLIISEGSRLFPPRNLVPVP